MPSQNTITTIHNTLVAVGGKQLEQKFVKILTWASNAILSKLSKCKKETNKAQSFSTEFNDHTVGPSNKCSGPIQKSITDHDFWQDFHSKYCR